MVLRSCFQLAGDSSLCHCLRAGCFLPVAFCSVWWHLSPLQSTWCFLYYVRFGKLSVGATWVESRETELCVSSKAWRQIMMLSATRKAQTQVASSTSHACHCALNQMCSLRRYKDFDDPHLQISVAPFTWNTGHILWSIYSSMGWSLRWGVEVVYLQFWPCRISGRMGPNPVCRAAPIASVVHMATMMDGGGCAEMFENLTCELDFQQRV